MAERTSPVFLVISSQVGWIVWVDLHSAAAAVVPFLTSHNGYYVNLLAGAKKRARSPLNQDRAHGKKLTLSLTETLYRRLPPLLLPPPPDEWLAPPPPDGRLTLPPPE
jgi:hypothetical protein